MLVAQLCLFVTHTVAHEAPLSMEFFRQKYWLLLLSRFSQVRLCATPPTAAHQAPLSTGFSRHEYWSGLPFPSPKRGLTDGKDMTERVHFRWGPTITTLFLIVWIFNGLKRNSVYCPTFNGGSIRSGRMFGFLFAVF